MLQRLQPKQRDVNANSGAVGYPSDSLASCFHFFSNSFDVRYVCVFLYMLCFVVVM